MSAPSSSTRVGELVDCAACYAPLSDRSHTAPLMTNRTAGAAAAPPRALRWREIRKLAEIHRNRRLSQSIVRLVGGHHSQRSTKGGTVSIPSQGSVVLAVATRTANNRRCAIYAPLILAQSVCDWRLCSSARFAARVLVCVRVCVCVCARACVCVFDPCVLQWSSRLWCFGSRLASRNGPW
jgi:hypothetical protein